MHIFSAIAFTVLTLAHAGASADVENTQNKGSIITVPMLRNPKGYMGTLRSSIGKLDRRQNAEQLYNAAGREYLVEIEVGTPPQKFNVTLDTGRYAISYVKRVHDLVYRYSNCLKLYAMDPLHGLPYYILSFYTI